MQTSASRSTFAQTYHIVRKEPLSLNLANTKPRILIAIQRIPTIIYYKKTNYIQGSNRYMRGE